VYHESKVFQGDVQRRVGTPWICSQIPNSVTLALIVDDQIQGTNASSRYAVLWPISRRMVPPAGSVLYPLGCFVWRMLVFLTRLWS